jgi:hypothetical protein
MSLRCEFRAEHSQFEGISEFIDYCGNALPLQRKLIFDSLNFVSVNDSINESKNCLIVATQNVSASWAFIQRSLNCKKRWTETCKPIVFEVASGSTMAIHTICNIL